MSVLSKTTRVAWAIVVGILVVILLGLCLTQYHKLRTMQKEKVASLRENRDVEARTKELRTNVDRFNSDPVFVERTAREMGMVKPDETIVKLTNRNIRLEPPAETNKPPKASRRP